MKKLLLLFVVVAVCGCAVRNRSVDPEMAAAVAARIESGDYRVYFEDMDSEFMVPISESDKWNIELRDGVLNSYLPYFGRAYVAMTGPQQGLDFVAAVQDYKVRQGRRGALEVSFWAKSDEDSYNYRLTAYPDGTAYLRVNPNLKTSIGFSGKLELP